MKRETKEAIIFVSVALLLASFMIGSMEALDFARKPKEEVCQYRSIISFTPGRALACELFRPRFE